MWSHLKAITKSLKRFLFLFLFLYRIIEVYDGGLYRAYRVLRFMYGNGGLCRAYRVFRLMYSDGGLSTGDIGY